MLRYVSVVCMALLTLDCTFNPTHARTRRTHCTPNTSGSDTSPSTGESEDQLLAMGVLTHVTSFLEDLQPHVRDASCFDQLFF